MHRPRLPGAPTRLPRLRAPSRALRCAVLLAAGTASLAALTASPTNAAQTAPRASVTDEPDPEGLELFERSVRPALVEHCVPCHGPGKQKSGLRLDSAASLARGGSRGPAVVPGQPGQSRLLQAVLHEGELAMPPRQDPLPASTAKALREWIRRGAPWPATAPGAETATSEGGASARAFDLRERIEQLPWIWTPPSAEPLPAVQDPAWPREDLDAFVLAGLEGHELTPAPDADPEVWLRRLSYALIGLPPTPEELADFLADTAPGARERQVDRLLASPHFGERWARHWMDLMRYAESRGHESDYPIANAWRYRDALIRALNEDVPYDRFVTEHLAGDLLDPPRRHPGTGANESVQLTGWAYLGEEVHSPVDIRQDECERIDNKVDVLSKAFLGLTVACARCHDHKFDAISAKDYYSLAGFFLSSTYRQTRFETAAHNAQVGRELSALREAFGPQLARVTAQALSPALERLPATLLAAEELGDDDDQSKLHAVRMWDFESGSMDGWELVDTPHGDGKVFATAGNMPTTLPATGYDDATVQGRHFVRTWDGNVLGDSDAPTGVVQTPPFVLEPGAHFDFLIGGGAHAFRGDPDAIEADITAFTLERQVADGDWEVLAAASGPNGNQLRPAVWDASRWAGETVRLRIYDTHQGGWGHIDLDAVRYCADDSEARARLERVAARDDLDPVLLRAWLPAGPMLEERASAPAPPLSSLPAGTRVLADYTTEGCPSADDPSSDHSSDRRTQWIPQGPTFGEGPRPRGTLHFGQDARAVLQGVQQDGAAVAEPSFAVLDLAPGTERESGSLGGWVRAGRSLLTPKFRLESGRVFILARGALRSYAAIDSHVMVTGPLHGGLIRAWGDDGGALRWVEHDLRGYTGHRGHLELSAVDDRGLEILAVVEADAAPPLPVGEGSLLSSRADFEESTAWAKAVQAQLQAACGLLATARLEGASRTELATVDWLLRHQDLFLDASAAAGLTARSQEFARLQQSVLDRIRPHSATAPSMQDLTAVDEQVLHRGRYQDPREPAPRGLPEAFGALAPLPPTPGSGRLELARRIVDPANPLAARVLVNRVWHHLFGVGIVPTVDNFGQLGQRPTHPELLDHLAHDFVHEQHWSTKTLIRKLVLSRAWGMSSRPDDERAERLDPTNQWLHRMRVRRLEGEALRDAMLAISGRLEPEPYGPPVLVHLTPFVIGRGRPGSSGPLDGDGRRSVYTAVRRNFLPTMMLAYDTPAPVYAIGRRNQTNVPAQALVLMNDDFVVEQAAVWARRLLAEHQDAGDAARITHMYEACYARRPSEVELAACQDFLRQTATLLPAGAPPERVWAELGHALWNVKEFVYVP